MGEIKRDWDLLNDEERTRVIEKVIGFFETERGEEIGVVAGGEILDMFLQAAGRLLYNRGVEETKSFLREQLQNLEREIEINLKKD